MLWMSKGIDMPFMKLSIFSLLFYPWVCGVIVVALRAFVSFYVPFVETYIERSPTLYEFDIVQKYLGKRKIIDIEERADWETLDSIGEVEGERAIHHNDNSNKDPLSDDSVDDL
ncbi:hypothetical protein M5K25_022241 [Dendrobium thyrsiflorum]|uniref:Uncharacterized protein n=1 Tax=Dendrobium thyrsiflorum TaxID=117978 RepID=A0ABD0U5X3_DENTH